MSKIPTAEEFVLLHNSKGVDLEWVYVTKEAMIEFAKIHVEAAIKMCIEEAPSGSSTDTVSYEDVVNALKDCYPLTNIK